MRLGEIDKGILMGLSNKKLDLRGIINSLHPQTRKFCAPSSKVPRLLPRLMRVGLISSERPAGGDTILYALTDLGGKLLKSCDHRGCRGGDYERYGK